MWDGFTISKKLAFALTKCQPTQLFTHDTAKTAKIAVRAKERVARLLGGDQGRHYMNQTKEQYQTGMEQNNLNSGATAFGNVQKTV